MENFMLDKSSQSCMKNVERMYKEVEDGIGYDYIIVVSSR
jgi:hypothetical protein